MKKIAVITPKSEQFRNFLDGVRAQDREQFVWAHDAHSVRGMEFSAVVCVGEYWDVCDLHQLEQLIRSHIRD